VLQFSEPENSLGTAGLLTFVLLVTWVVMQACFYALVYGFYNESKIHTKAVATREENDWLAVAFELLKTDAPSKGHACPLRRHGLDFPESHDSDSRLHAAINRKESAGTLGQESPQTNYVSLWKIMRFLKSMQYIDPLVCNFGSLLGTEEREFSASPLQLFAQKLVCLLKERSGTGKEELLEGSGEESEIDRLVASFRSALEAEEGLVEEENEEGGRAGGGVEVKVEDRDGDIREVNSADEWTPSSGLVNELEMARERTKSRQDSELVKESKQGRQQLARMMGIGKRRRRKKEKKKSRTEEEGRVRQASATKQEAPADGGARKGKGKETAEAKITRILRQTLGGQRGEQRAPVKGAGREAVPEYGIRLQEFLEIVKALKALKLVDGSAYAGEPSKWLICLCGERLVYTFYRLMVLPSRQVVEHRRYMKRRNEVQSLFDLIDEDCSGIVDESELRTAVCCGSPDNCSANNDSESARFFDKNVALRSALRSLLMPKQHIQKVARTMAKVGQAASKFAAPLHRERRSSAAAPMEPASFEMDYERVEATWTVKEFMDTPSLRSYINHGCAEEVQHLLKEINATKGDNTDVTAEMCGEWLRRNEEDDRSWRTAAVKRVMEIKLRNDANPCAHSLVHSDRVRSYNACYDAWRGKHGLEDHDFWSCRCLPPEWGTSEQQLDDQKCSRCRAHMVLMTKFGYGVNVRIFDAVMYGLVLLSVYALVADSEAANVSFPKGPHGKWNRENGVNFWGYVTILSTFAFVGEVSIKVYAFGWIEYWRDEWNRLDFFVSTMGVLLLFQQFIISKKQATYFLLIKIGRAFRVAKLLKTTQSSQRLVDALYECRYLIMYLAVALFCVIYFYAVIGCWLFSDEACRIALEHAGDVHFTFSTPGQAMMLLFAWPVGVDWSTWPGTLVAVASSGRWSIWYWISYYFVSIVIVLNVMDAIIFDAFQAAHEKRYSSIKGEWEDVISNPTSSGRLEVRGRRLSKLEYVEPGENYHENKQRVDLYEERLEKSSRVKKKVTSVKDRLARELA
jgi:hypothetical protein